MSGGSRSSLEPVAALIARRTGLHIPKSRHDALAAAVARSMARTRATSASELVDRLTSSPAEMEALAAELTIPESYFFRAPEQLQLLRRDVLPEILRRCGPGHRLRLLSAGCAGGEEPYSLAILLDEEGLGTQSTVIGADISRAALARATAASYGSWSLRGTDENFRSLYFQRAGSSFHLLPRLRDRVEFTWLNLGEDFHPSHATGIIAFDVIFCRNALIYFDAAGIARAAARLFASLCEGGWLFTGASDPPLSEHAPFETVPTTAGPLYRRPVRKAASAEIPAPVPFALEPPSRVEPRLPAAGPRPPRRESRAPRAAPASADEVRALADQGRLAEALAAAADLARSQPGSAELHFLHAILLAEAGRDREAADLLRRALYLDRKLAVGALALGFSLRRLGDPLGARRAFKQARALLAGLPPGEPVPLADGEIAGRLLMTVDIQLGLLEESKT